jgi:hypothetical protein
MYKREEFNFHNVVELIEHTYRKRRKYHVEWVKRHVAEDSMGFQS